MISACTKEIPSISTFIVTVCHHFFLNEQAVRLCFAMKKENRSSLSCLFSFSCCCFFHRLWLFLLGFEVIFNGFAIDDTLDLFRCQGLIFNQ